LKGGREHKLKQKRISLNTRKTFLKKIFFNLRTVESGTGSPERLNSLHAWRFSRSY